MLENKRLFPFVLTCEHIAFDPVKRLPKICDVGGITHVHSGDNFCELSPAQSIEYHREEVLRSNMDHFFKPGTMCVQVRAPQSVKNHSYIYSLRASMRELVCRQHGATPYALQKFVNDINDDETKYYFQKIADLIEIKTDDKSTLNAFIVNSVPPYTEITKIGVIKEKDGDFLFVSSIPATTEFKGAPMGTLDAIVDMIPFKNTRSAMALNLNSYIDEINGFVREYHGLRFNALAQNAFDEIPQKCIIEYPPVTNPTKVVVNLGGQFGNTTLFSKNVIPTNSRPRSPPEIVSLAVIEGIRKQLLTKEEDENLCIVRFYGYLTLATGVTMICLEYCIHINHNPQKCDCH